MDKHEYDQLSSTMRELAEAVHSSLVGKEQELANFRSEMDIIRTSLERILKFVEGNGNPSLMERLVKIEGELLSHSKSISKTVSKSEFSPVKSVVFGMVGIILIAVIGALVALVINK